MVGYVDDTVRYVLIPHGPLVDITGINVYRIESKASLYRQQVRYSSKDLCPSRDRRECRLLLYARW